MPHLHHGALGSSPVSLILTIFAVLVYLRGWLHVRSTSSNVIDTWRAGSFVLGLFSIWAALASPIAVWDEASLTGHMIQHLLLMTFAAPLVLLGAPVLALWNGLPQRFAQGVLPILRWSLLQRVGRALTQPALCWLAATAALVVWHVPAAFTLGLQSEAWHVFEQTSFLATGLLFWWPVVQPWPSVSRWPEWSMILYLFLATLPCDILSGFLVFSDRVAYSVYLSTSRPDLSVLGDQQCAGALMWTCVTIIYLVAGAILSTRLLATPQKDPQSLEAL